VTYFNSGRTITFTRLYKVTLCLNHKRRHCQDQLAILVFNLTLLYYRKIKVPNLIDDVDAP